MTRENKLALVVGFGLILVVGILVSDHFSAARNQESAELASAEPLDPARWEDPELILLTTGQSGTGAEPARPRPAAAVAPADGPTRRPADTPPPRPGVRPLDPMMTEAAGDAATAIEMGGRPSGVGLDPAAARALPYRFHDVRPGESLTAICRQHYGDASLVAELARFNGLADPDALRAHRRLRIPDAADLVRGRTAGPPESAPAPAPSERAAGSTRYAVAEGDTLSHIAQRHLGSGRRYLALYEANRDVLESPDDLRPGMILKIPRRVN